MTKQPGIFLFWILTESFEPEPLRARRRSLSNHPRILDRQNIGSEGSSNSFRSAYLEALSNSIETQHQARLELAFKPHFRLHVTSGLERARGSLQTSGSSRVGEHLAFLVPGVNSQ